MTKKTDYFSADCVDTFTKGACYDFAFALNRMTGWKIGVLWHDPVIDQFTLFFSPTPTHAFCITPDGRAIDVKGLRNIDDLTALYEDDRATPRIQTFADESGWAALEKVNSHVETKMPNDLRIELTRKIIMASPAFLDLIKNLSVSTQRPASPAPQ